MFLNLRKLLFVIVFNSSLFLVLIIGLQNSNLKSKINLLNRETVELPVGFTMGLSFIAGSIISNLISFNLNNNK